MTSFNLVAPARSFIFWPNTNALQVTSVLLVQFSKLELIGNSWSRFRFLNWGVQHFSCRCFSLVINFVLQDLPKHRLLLCILLFFCQLSSSKLLLDSLLGISLFRCWRLVSWFLFAGAGSWGCPCSGWDPEPASAAAGRPLRGPFLWGW